MSISVTLPDHSVLGFDAPVSAADVAARIGERLARAAVAAEVNGVVCDLATTLEADATVRILTARDAEGLDVMRHSASHVMAEAIERVVPGTRFVYGPAIEDGFYYDVDPPQAIAEADLPAIEAEMQKIVEADAPFRRREVSRDQANAEMADDPYKLDNIARATGDVISFYRSGDGFEDLCAGPHVPSAGRIGAFKLMSISGAYWHGDASKQQLTRVYGTTWPDAKQLKAYLRRLEEAKKRDHRELNRALDIYSTHEDIGAGLVLWHPNGGMIRHLIESFWCDEHLRRGYQILYTPHIANERIYQASGHLENYADLMYSPMEIDAQPYRIKPMNCPAHIKIYQSTLRSYRDLPLRWCELGTVYRYEPSGTLHGMLRVRGFTQDDSHIFCTQEQLADEVIGVLDLMDFMMTTFGYTYKAFLATRPEKSLGTDDEWEWSTKALIEALQRRGMHYEVDEGGGVFYAPKIDIKLVDALGREWQGPTTQVDLNLPKRFGVEYVASDNSRREAVMIHRTVLGSMERFVGGLIEHYAGDFPLWLAPQQVRVLNITDAQQPYAQEVAQALSNAGLRVRADVRGETIGHKIREATLAHVPYCAVVGNREVDGRTVSLRHRNAGDLGPRALDACIAELAAESTSRALPRGWGEN